jgi:tetratricopeptide (TPR) repeat protein
MRSVFLHAVLFLVVLLPMIFIGRCTAGDGAGTTRELPAGSPDTLERSLPLLPNVSFPGQTLAAYDWYEQGFVLTSQERYSEALTAYGKALSLNRSLLNAWYYSGDALFRLGRYDEALLAFGNATAVDPDFVDAYFYESLVYDRLGRPREGKDALRKGLEAAERRMEKGGYRGAGAATAGGFLPAPDTPVIASLGIALAVGFRSLRRKGRIPEDPAPH